MGDNVCFMCLNHYPCNHGNDSNNYEPGALCACGHENIVHGKSTLVSPGCDACGCERFRPA